MPEGAISTPRSDARSLGRLPCPESQRGSLHGHLRRGYSLHLLLQIGRDCACCAYENFSPSSFTDGRCVDAAARRASAPACRLSAKTWPGPERPAAARAEHRLWRCGAGDLPLRALLLSVWNSLLAAYNSIRAFAPQIGPVGRPMIESQSRHDRSARGFLNRWNLVIGIVCPKPALPLVEASKVIPARIFAGHGEIGEGWCREQDQAAAQRSGKWQAHGTLLPRMHAPRKHEGMEKQNAPLGARCASHEQRARPDKLRRLAKAKAPAISDGGFFISYR